MTFNMAAITDPMAPICEMFCTRVNVRRLESSTSDDMLSVDALRRVAGVDDELGVGHDRAVVVLRVICDDDHAIEIRDLFQRSADHVKGVFAPLADRREKWVVVFNAGTAFLQEF